MRNKPTKPKPPEDLFGLKSGDSVEKINEIVKPMTSEEINEMITPITPEELEKLTISPEELEKLTLKSEDIEKIARSMMPEEIDELTKPIAMEEIFDQTSTDTMAEIEKIDSGSKTSPSGAPGEASLWSSIDKRTKEFPKAYRGLYQRAMEGKSRQAAIRANCLMCMGYQPGEVQKCTATACPLYPYRLRG